MVEDNEWKEDGGKLGRKETGKEKRGGGKKKWRSKKFGIMVKIR